MTWTRPGVSRSRISRVVVTIVALPLVLWLVWLGGWWLFALVLLAGLVALHELYGMARSLRPLVLAGYAGAIATLLVETW